MRILMKAGILKTSEKEEPACEISSFVIHRV